MGMDVMGLNPTEDTGEYFRNNVWWWRPLWNYCVHVAPELCEDVNGNYNDGDGLDAESSKELARILHNEIASGRTEEYRKAYYNYLSRLPRHRCEHCDGTGIRTDEVGVDHGMPSRELEPETAALLGRSHGWCNACAGEGMQEAWDTNYPFSVENVEEFANFVEHSGGFAIH